MSDQFQAFRPYLFSIAYRMLGSVEEAEDVLQDAFLKWHASKKANIQNLKSYLSTIVTRLCIDRLKALEKQRHLYQGPWLPELFSTQVTKPEPPQLLSTAFLILLEKLNPQERAVFLLRSAFEHQYEDIALILNKSPENCRQIFRRAKAKMTCTTHPTTNIQKVEGLLQQFIQLSESGRYTELQQLFSKEISLVADSGGKVKGAARQILSGPENIIKFILGVSRKIRPEGTIYELRYLNYEPAIVGMVNGKAFIVITVQEQEGQISRIFVHANPDKLKRI